MIGTHLACSKPAIVLHWICGKKLTAYEAEGSKSMVTKGPAMGGSKIPCALTALGYRARVEGTSTLSPKARR
jgi:hypothetical protein